MNWLKTQLEWLLIQDPGSLLVASLGWPAVFFSMILSISGVYLKKPLLLMFAAILISPISLYLLGGNNWIGKLFPLLPVLLSICWYTIRKKMYYTSWSILILTYSSFSYLVYLVIKK